MIVDHHVHLYPRSLRSSMDCLLGMNGSCGALLLARLRKVGVDQAVVFGYPSESFLPYPCSNHYVLDECAKSEGKLIPVALLDREPERWAEAGVHGFKEHVYGQRRTQWEPSFADDYKKIEGLGLPLLIHAPVDALDRIARIQDAAPTLAITVAHLGWHFETGTLPTIGEVTELCEGFAERGVSVDSSSIDDPVLIEAARVVLGPERVRWGSDYPTDGKPLRRPPEWVTGGLEHPSV